MSIVEPWPWSSWFCYRCFTSHSGVCPLLPPAQPYTPGPTHRTAAMGAAIVVAVDAAIKPLRERIETLEREVAVLKPRQSMAKSDLEFHAANAAALRQLLDECGDDPIMGPQLRSRLKDAERRAAEPSAPSPAAPTERHP